MEVIQNIELEVLKEFRKNVARLSGTEESEQEAEELEQEAEELEQGIETLEESVDDEFQLSEESEIVGLGLDMDEELEMEVKEDTVAPPEPVLDSGSEDWDLTLG